MYLYEIAGKKPIIDPEVAWIADSAILIGDVTIGKGTVLFDNVVIEGHPGKVSIGNYCNLQSGTIVHTLEDSATIIGDYVTVGHRSLLHGCHLEDYSTVGMGSVVMGYTHIKKGCLIGAGALVTEKKTFDERSLILGSPAKTTKMLPESQIQEAKTIALRYTAHGLNEYRMRKKISKV